MNKLLWLQRSFKRTNYDDILSRGFHSFSVEGFFHSVKHFGISYRPFVSLRNLHLLGDSTKMKETRKFFLTYVYKGGI